ncbi:hypothetical protein BDB01DRAFT_900238 [Pilobolus umbonatus]|nr:hypothetical protein BDB01DRAFT_900238 [Pilobolus umbonatus]
MYGERRLGSRNIQLYTIALLNRVEISTCRTDKKRMKLRIRVVAIVELECVMDVYDLHLIPLRDHSGGRPKCSHPLKSVEELTGGRECGCYDAGILVVVVIMLGGVILGILPTTLGIRWLLTFSLVDPVNRVLSVLEN